MLVDWVADPENGQHWKQNNYLGQNPSASLVFDKPRFTLYLFHGTKENDKKQDTALVFVESMWNRKACAKA